MKTEVTVVVGVWGRCPDQVSVWALEQDAQKGAKRLRREYGIKPGQESESEHAVRIFYNCTVRGG